MVYLAQTDTTVGFLSFCDKKLAKVKGRDPKQKTLKVVDSFNTLKEKVRVPNRYKKRLRRSKKTTYIYPNGLSFRVVDPNSDHHSFVKKFGTLFSTSANRTKKDFEEDFAVKNSDIVLYTKDGFNQNRSSTIYKINNKKIIRLR